MEIQDPNDNVAELLSTDTDTDATEFYKNENYLRRIYQYRFKQVDLKKKEEVWVEIARWIEKSMNYPNIILDPAAGNFEFLRNISSSEKWAVDLQLSQHGKSDPKLKFIQGNIFEVDLPEKYFDGAFISNFLEHLNNPEEIQKLLTKIYKSLKPGGLIVVMGPNFKYCAKDYYDCADHRLSLSHIAVEEHLFSVGFEIHRSISRFLPYSFRSFLLPTSAWLVKIYLRIPFVWKLLGKQFLVFGRKISA